MKSIPTTLPTGKRHVRPWKDKQRSLMVPLLTTDKGDLHEGYITVPKRLVNTPEHTNERLEFNAHIGKHLQNWLEWKAKQGWAVIGTPKVSGPYDPFMAKPGMELPEDKWYWVQARFCRTSPLMVGLEDFLEIRDRAQRYGVNIEAPRPASTPLSETKDVIVDDTPAHNPLKYAEERRQKLGLKRKDLLIGDLSEPLAYPEEPGI